VMLALLETVTTKSNAQSVVTALTGAYTI